MIKFLSTIYSVEVIKINNDNYGAPYAGMPQEYNNFETLARFQFKKYNYDCMVCI